MAVLASDLTVDLEVKAAELVMEQAEAALPAQREVVVQAPASVQMAAQEDRMEEAAAEDLRVLGASAMVERAVLVREAVVPAIVRQWEVSLVEEWEEMET